MAGCAWHEVAAVVAAAAVAAAVVAVVAIALVRSKMRADGRAQEEANGGMSLGIAL